MEDAIIPLGVFTAGALIVFVIMYFKYKMRSGVQETIRLALEKGNELSPELLDRLSTPKEEKASDLRRGTIFLSVGVAFALFGFIIGEEDAVRPLMGVGMFPIMVGVAYLLLWRTRDRELQR